MEVVFAFLRFHKLNSYDIRKRFARSGEQKIPIGNGLSVSNSTSYMLSMKYSRNCAVRAGLTHLYPPYSLVDKNVFYIILQEKIFLGTLKHVFEKSPFPLHFSNYRFLRRLYCILIAVSVHKKKKNSYGL